MYEEIHLNVEDDSKELFWNDDDTTKPADGGWVDQSFKFMTSRDSEVGSMHLSTMPYGKLNINNTV